MKVCAESTSMSVEMGDRHDQMLREHLGSLRTSGDAGTFATAEGALLYVQSLERRQHAQSRFRRMAGYLQPLIDFLMIYTPALDIMVQFDPNPSVIVWGALKALLQVLTTAIRSYRFIECALAKLADILSNSVRYEKMFENERGVQIALKGLYVEVLSFLQRVQATICKKSSRLLVESFFRSIDVQFQDNIQQLSRAHESFREEVTFAHRQHIQNHINEQRLANITLEQVALKSTRHPNLESENLSKRTSILQWLDQGDVSGAFRQALKKRTSGTGLWLLQTPTFQRWMPISNESGNDSRLIWIYGLPGAGKTVLSSVVIQYLQSLRVPDKKEDCKVAYFYSSSLPKSHRTAVNICAGALSQLLGQVEEIPGPLHEGYRIANHHGRPKICEADDVFSMFNRVTAVLPAVFLIIDSLDECTDITSIVSWLEDAVQSVHSLHVACFSRDISAIRKSLERRPTIRIDSASIKDDIDTYLTSAIDTLPSIDNSFKSLILSTLSEKAEGMFLLAHLSIEMLQSAIHEEDMHKMLRVIPGGVNEMYLLILERLSAESETRRCLASRVLRLLCFSAQSMTWHELRYALSWNENEQCFQKNREPFRETIYDLCSPLIEYQSETDAFRLAHLSLCEFLCKGYSQLSSSYNVSQFFVAEAEAQRELASITLACVSDVEVSHQFKVDLNSRPLLPHATKNWCNYLCRSPLDEKLRKRYFKFMDCPQRRSTWILRWLLSEERAFALQKVVKVQKLLQERTAEYNQVKISVSTLLNDTQRALFQLDRILAPSSAAGHHGVISNFERLTCVRDLAREYTMANEIEYGVEMFESELREADILSDKIAPSSCWLLNSLGILYDQQGRTELARKTQQKALNIQDKWLPENHLDIVLTVNELGRVARHMNQFEEAETLHRRALRILERLFPSGDLQIVWTKNALGRALLKQNRPDEALLLHQQAFATECERLGRNHPHTLWTLSDIARCHCAQGKIEAAIEIQRELVERSESSVGISNPDTLWAKNSLGNFYELLGRLTEARKLHTEALIGQTAQLGPNHSHTLWSKQILAKLEELTNGRTK